MLDAALTVRVGIAALSLIGVYVSLFMLRKYFKAQRGGLEAPSVVMSPRAKLARVPNALSGLIFYTLLLALTPFLSSAHLPVVYAALAAAALAALVSLYLAYSLLFVTRMPCLYCWISHVVNWSLMALLIVATRLFSR
ncbi:MAG TPA: vitamin K epoxide reductase family protein [Candidatus Eremiobacteraceae bacterium]|nr:vitamin K epoxide reductase family protein [Candidatus Eremiobacteraceae bacterium]